MGVCDCSMFCCTFLYVHSSFAIIFIGKRELVALHGLSSWCLVVVVWLFLAVLWVSGQFVIVVFPDLAHYVYDIGIHIVSSEPLLLAPTTYGLKEMQK